MVSRDRTSGEPPSEDRFAGKSAWFEDHYATTRGRIRLELVLERLNRILPRPPARILDAGGGTGAFAVPLARAGYEVTLIDQSAEWLERARAYAKAARASVHFRQLEIERVTDLELGPFDCILCHAVLMYAKDPVVALRALRAVCREGAVLSLLEKNGDSLALRPGMTGDYPEAQRLLVEHDSVGRLGIENRAYGLDEWRSMLAASAWDLRDWVGVRLFSDFAPDEVDPHSYEALLDLERAAGRRSPYRMLARLIHISAIATTGYSPRK
jgi:SAM-dependent methyltransferase